MFFSLFESRGERRMRKIVWVIFVISLVLLPAIISLAAQLNDDVLDKYEPWPVSGKLKLDWVVYPWHTVRFWDCKGFIIDANDTELDLNGHTVMFKSGVAGPGLTGVEVIGKGGVRIKNGTIIDFQYGVWIQDSGGVEVESLNISGSGKNGIWARNSEDVDIGFNKVTASGDVALGIDNCFHVSIRNNKVSDNNREGIYLKESDHNNVNKNLASLNGYYGIYVVDSHDNTFSGNTISDNLPNGGIYMSGADYNVIGNNTLSNNPTGMEIKSSSYNIIYHNNFLGDSVNVECDEASSNVWDAGYGLVEDIGYGGNYWDGYGSTDEFSGKNQDVPGSDGVSDAVYAIDESNQDSYPLMNPLGTMLVDCDIIWPFFDPRGRWEDRTCQAVVFSDSSVADFDFNRAEGELKFNATNGTFCNVIVPRDALDGAFTVTVDGSLSASVLTWDENHHFIHFSMVNGSHEVKIKAETVIRLIGDLNNDGIVNIVDIAIVATYFGNQIG